MFFSDAFDDIAPILQQEENKLAVFSLIILTIVLQVRKRMQDVKKQKQLKEQVQI